MSVLAERDIARVVRLVFDAPMSAIVFEQSPGVGLFASEIRDAVGDFGGCLPLARFAIAGCSLARDAKHLPHAGPTPSREHEIEGGRGLDGPLFATAVAFVVRGVTLAFRLTLPGLVGGLYFG